MKKKLNNKGITVVEILICFSIVSIITITMFKAINSYRDKEEEESFKMTVNTYRTSLTKVIYSDIIKNKGIKEASVEQIEGSNISSATEAYKSLNFTYRLSLKYKNDSTAVIDVVSKTRCITSSRNASGKRVLAYDQDCICTNYDANGLCSGNDEYNVDKNSSQFYVKYKNEIFELPKIDGLKYNEVLTEMKSDGFINIHIGLWHIDYGSKYDALNIVVPDVSKYPEMF